MSNKITDTQLIINTNPSETRIALLENGRLAELHIGRNREQGLVGSVFKGIVIRVLPGMNSAFVDIGLDKAAFLFGGDVFDPDGQPEAISGEEGLDIRSRDRKPVERLLKDGQTVIVQVAKEALGSKGPRVSMYLTLPGRYLVLMPNVRHIGVSRRIEEEKERDRLKDVVENLIPEHCGLIIRTAAINANTDDLKKEVDYLTELWKSIEKSVPAARPPSLLFRDLDMIQKMTRDLYDARMSRIIVDNKDAYLQLSHFLEMAIPPAKERLSLHESGVPLFDCWGIEIDIGRALGSRVELPSGGYLIIEQTEALTSFDVNTGKFVGKANARHTIFKTNLEATKKVVEQLRIRNIGGIIVLDFIDMEDLSDREEIYQALKDELRFDRARTNVLKVSELGLVQMSRKRTSESLGRKLQVSCSYCDGTGYIRSVETEAYDLMREIVRCHIQSGETNFNIRVRPDVRGWIEKKEKSLLDGVIARYQLSLTFANTEMTAKLLREPCYEVLPRGADT